MLGSEHTQSCWDDDPGGDEAQSKHGITEAPQDAHASPYIDLSASALPKCVMKY